MNQYIINETMLQTWRKGCLNPKIPHTDDDTCKKCKYRGKGLRKNCCDFDDNAMEDIFRSYPYQSERDAVLERLHIWFENYCEGNEDPDLWMVFLHAERTLRQAGELDA